MLTPCTCADEPGTNYDCPVWYPVEKRTGYAHPLNNRGTSSVVITRTGAPARFAAIDTREARLEETRKREELSL